jgi:hypothetical protein
LSVKVNLDLPDSAFVVDLPLGTRVQGPGPVSYVVGDEILYFDETVGDITVDPDCEQDADATGPASQAGPSGTPDPGGPAGRGQKMAPAGRGRSGPSILWKIIGAVAVIGGGLLILASVRGRGRAKAGGE